MSQNQHDRTVEDIVLTVKWAAIVGACFLVYSSPLLALGILAAGALLLRAVLKKLF